MIKYIQLNVGKIYRKQKGNKKMQELETVEAVHTHTHTGYIIKINKVEQKKNIRLFSNVFYLRIQKVCKQNILLSSFFAHEKEKFYLFKNNKNYIFNAI